MFTNFTSMYSTLDITKCILLNSSYFNFLLLLISMVPTNVNAHPTGNIIVVGDKVFWPYVAPVNDSGHHACVMRWEPGSEPEVIIRSEFEGSDFILYNNEEVIYMLERRFNHRKDKHELRLHKMRLNEEPKVIWDWFEDKNRIGENGFIMSSDHDMWYASSPNVYCIHQESLQIDTIHFNVEVKRIRQVDNNKILLLGKDNCWLSNSNGVIIKSWEGLLDQGVQHAPLNFNMIFDVDYKNDKLLLAYWGKQIFQLYEEGNQIDLTLPIEHIVPHWVAFYESDLLLFASKMIFNGSNPEPHLIKYSGPGISEIIWSD